MKNLLFSKYLDLYERAYYCNDDSYGLEVDKMVSFFEPKIKTVLDIGSGTGRHAAELLKRKFQVHCIDISNEAIKRTIENTGLSDEYVEKADII
ncbi:MAG: hypothetical protein ACD_9C00150G0001 [uncultured bacterium]|nr:MAG: hypothetical protein ACD_9C00150G0001 [uncultured bacterium]